MKSIAKRLVVKILGWQVRRLRTKADFKVIAVAGSIGKTSTKFAIATILSEKYRVRWQKGNYNDIVSVPLVFFGLPMPSLFNPAAWIWTFLKIEMQIRRKYSHDVVVVEVGTDFPGNLKQFKQYLQADLGVLTAISPEHMEFFKDIDEVAVEELTISELADNLLVNLDLCDKKYLDRLESYVSYGVHEHADYQLGDMKSEVDGYDFSIRKNTKLFLQEKHASIAKTQLLSIVAAVATADMLGLNKGQIKSGIEKIKPVNGRMQRLQGVNKSVILDDTYNSSPEAAMAALETLYDVDATQKIALLGNMNELGSYSQKAHKEIGQFCDPNQLDLVVTLGPDANTYLAAEAEKRGCIVERTDTPYAAAEKIHEVIREGAVILAKGSQNKVFAEEAVKRLLANTSDEALLVRQSGYWMKVKEKSVGKP